MVRCDIDRQLTAAAAGRGLLARGGRPGCTGAPLTATEVTATAAAAPSEPGWLACWLCLEVAGVLELHDAAAGFSSSDCACRQHCRRMRRTNSAAATAAKADAATQMPAIAPGDSEADALLFSATYSTVLGVRMMALLFAELL